MLLFVAPAIAGAGPHLLGDLPGAVALTRMSVRPVGRDLLVEAYVNEP